MLMFLVVEPHLSNIPFPLYRANFQWYLQSLPIFLGLRPCARGSTSLFSSFQSSSICDTAQFTLCYGLNDCSLSNENFIHSLSTLHYCNAPSLAARLTGDYRGRTYTVWRGPASQDTRHTAHKKGCLKSLI